jgi:hypothetical protein
MINIYYVDTKEDTITVVPVSSNYNTAIALARGLLYIKEKYVNIKLKELQEDCQDSMRFLQYEDSPLYCVVQ